MQRKLTRDITPGSERFPLGCVRDYPEATWRQIADSAGMELDDFTESVEVEFGPGAAAQAADEPKPAAISSAVRELLDEHAIDPDTIEGTGKNGAILKADVLRAVDAAAEPEPDDDDGEPEADPEKEAE